jgi:hypothetical protein
LETFLSHEQRERVLTVEFICHGVPSLRVFHSYLKELFQGESIASYTFRDKTFGWQSVLAESVSGRRHHLPATRDAFFAGFCIHHLYMMESCHACAFARLPRAGDVTLGDFWRCPEQWYDKRGVSLVLANTSAGLHALESVMCSGRIVLEPVDLFTATNSAQRIVSGNRAIPELRRTFLDGVIVGKGFGVLQSAYFPKPVSLWRDRWSRFCNSDRKLSFLFDSVRRRLVRRVTGSKVAT